MAPTALRLPFGAFALSTSFRKLASDAVTEELVRFTLVCVYFKTTLTIIQLSQHVQYPGEH